MDPRSWTTISAISLSILFMLVGGCTTQLEFSITRAEKSTLLQLRSTLGLRAKEWPKRANPCTSWAGIQCSNGRVTGMNIFGFRRTRKGTKNPRFSVEALRELTLLTSFNASNLPLPGPIPIWFGLQLPSLRVLDLTSCSINGTIPFTLCSLINLEKLYLSNNNLTGAIPWCLFQFPGLSEIGLSGNSLTGQIPGVFIAPRNVRVLDLSDNSLYGCIPPGIGRLSGLEVLNFSRNGFSSSIPAQLGNLRNLLVLDLGCNSLSGHVVGINFTGMERLERIILRDNNFSGELPDNLWSLPTLQFLDVSRNNFTGIIPNIAAAPVAAANISHNSFYGNITSIIGRFSRIDLSGNYLQGKVPKHADGTRRLSRNCLRNVANQRDATECASFYAARKLEFDTSGELETSAGGGGDSAIAKSENEEHKRHWRRKFGMMYILIVAMGLFVMFHVAAAGIWGRAAVEDLYRLCFGFLVAQLRHLCRLRLF